MVVVIICKNHGEFKQTPTKHLQLRGCQKCSSSKGELLIENILIENNIIYNNQQEFEGCFYKGKLKFDFYLPEHNLCVEFDGVQHFKPVDFFGGYEEAIL